MDDTVDDADGPALHYHGLGSFIGQEVFYTRPHPSSMCQYNIIYVNIKQYVFVYLVRFKGI